MPLLYDWLTHRNLNWPSSSARWGPVLKRYADRVVQRLFYGERTGETDYLNTLVVAKVEVPYGGISDRQRLPKFSESPAPPASPHTHTPPRPRRSNGRTRCGQVTGAGAAARS